MNKRSIHYLIAGLSHVDIAMPTSIGTFAGFVLHRIHCARIKTRILGNELSAMETALKGGLIDPENTAHVASSGRPLAAFINTFQVLHAWMFPRNRVRGAHGKRQTTNRQ